MPSWSASLRSPVFHLPPLTNWMTPTFQPRAQPRHHHAEGGRGLALAVTGVDEDDRLRAGHGRRVVAGREARRAALVCGTTSGAGESFNQPGCASCWPARACGWRRSRPRTWRSTPRSHPAGRRSGTPSGCRRWRPGPSPGGHEPHPAQADDRLGQPGGGDGPATGVMAAAEYHAAKPGAVARRAMVLAGLRSRYDVVLCEGPAAPPRSTCWTATWSTCRWPGGRAAGDRGGRHRPGRRVAPRCTGPWRCCPTTGHRAGSWSTGCGAIPPCWATAPAPAGAALRRAHPGRAARAWWTSTTDSLTSIARPPIPSEGGDTVDVAAVRWRSGQRRRPRPAAPGAGRAGPLGAIGGGPGPARPGGAAGVEEHPGATWPGSAARAWPRRSSGRTQWWRPAPGCKWRAGPSRTPTGSRAGRGERGLGWLPVVTSFRGDKVLDRPAGRRHRGPGPGARMWPATASTTGGSGRDGPGAVAGGCGRRDPRLARRPVGGDDARTGCSSPTGSAPGWWRGRR